MGGYSLQIIDSKSRSNMYKIKSLVDNYSYNDFRNYKVLNKEMQSKYLFNQIWNIVKTPKCLIFASINKMGIQGFAVLKYLSWDSKLFGKNMWQIAYLIAEGSYLESIRIKTNLLKAILKYTKNIKNSHVSCRIDTSDISSIHALESVRFKLMDTIITWVFRPTINVPRFKDIFKVRDFQKKDLEELIKLAMHSFSTNRFHLDPNIPNDKADKMYAEWIKNYCINTTKKITRVKVAENKDGIVGFLGYRLNEDIKRISGYKIIGQGLMAVSRLAKGASISLVNATIKDVISNYDFAEFDALVTNHEAIKIYEAFNFEIIRSRHTFHLG